MNRAQRRMAEKAQRGTRAARLGRAGMDRYRHRAQRKMRGMVFRAMPMDDRLHGRWSYPVTASVSDYEALAEYAENAPHRWRIACHARFQADDGTMYVETVEAEVMQAVLIGELADEWRRMLDEARAGGNARHLHSEVVELEVMI